MTRKKSAAHGKNRPAAKRALHTDPEMDVLQDQFDGMALDFHALASLLGPQ
ncbi:MAG: hypothetical protein KGL53_15155 [Elusimicrobia bacterium]|nr:hypothetical protein [Elusimicrobiota bacterium]